MSELLGTTYEERAQIAENRVRRLELMLQMAYCQRIGTDTPHGLECCDNYRDWLTALTANAKVSGAGTASAGTQG